MNSTGNLGSMYDWYSPPIRDMLGNSSEFQQLKTAVELSNGLLRRAVARLDLQDEQIVSLQRQLNNLKTQK